MNKIKRFLRKHFKGRYLLIKKNVKRLSRKTKKILTDLWSNHLKEFLNDLWRLPIHLIKTVFTKNLVINISLAIIYLLLIKFLPNHPKLQGVLITVFTALNLTNGYLSYSKAKEDKLLAHSFIVEILNIFSLIGKQINYFRVSAFGIGDTLYHKRNTTAKNIELTHKADFKLEVKHIKKYLQNDFDLQGNFYIYFAFIRFMEENIRYLITLQETVIPNLILYISNPRTKGWLAHLQRVVIYLIKKYFILVENKADIAIKQTHQALYQISMRHEDISIKNLEEIESRKKIEKDKVIENLKFSNKERLIWRFDLQDIKDDLDLFLEILLELYPTLIKEIKPTKNQKNSIKHKKNEIKINKQLQKV